MKMDQRLHRRLGTRIRSTRLKVLGSCYVIISPISCSYLSYPLLLLWYGISFEQSRLNSIRLKDDTGTGVLAWLFCLSHLFGSTTYYSRGVLPNALLRIECFAILAYVGIKPVTWEINTSQNSSVFPIKMKTDSLQFWSYPWISFTNASFWVENTALLLLNKHRGLKTLSFDVWDMLLHIFLQISGGFSFRNGWRCHFWDFECWGMGIFAPRSIGMR